MFLSDGSLRRPIAMVCLIVALVCLGFNAFRKLGLEFMPKVDVPYITIVTTYPGASPQEIETDIARKIEDAVGAVDGLKHVSSSCMENVCQTLLEFELDRNIDVAADDVREKVDLIVNDLPDEAELPKILKYDINAKPIINLALTGDLSLGQLYDYADNELSDRLSSISGVAEVELIGGSELEVQVLLDRSRVAARGLTSLDVVQGIQQGIQTVPSGWVRQKGSEYSVKFDSQYLDFRDIGDLEIANQDGSRCYLKDLGRVAMIPEKERQAAFIDGRPAIAIRVVKKADANAVKVVERVRKELDSLRSELPGGMELVWFTDDADFIQSSVDSATSSVWQGVLLTAAVLFFFLFNLRSTFIVAVTMPVSFVISLFFLNYLGYTLNMSTLLSIGLSVGVLVTNSIVVLERIIKRLETSPDPGQAARLGAGDVAVAVLASAGTNLVVLLPVAFMGGMVGRFLKPFAVTMVIVTLVSLFVSFTLTPILCRFLLKPKTRGGRLSLLGRLEGWQNRLLGSVAGGYGRMLLFLGRRRWAAVIVLAAVLALLAASLRLAPVLGFSMVADSDRGEIAVKLEYPTGYDLEHTVARVREAEESLAGLPGLLHRYTTLGKVEGILGQSSEGVYLAQVLLKFVGKTQRRETIDDLLAEVRRRLADQPGVIVTASIPAVIGGQASPLDLEISGADLAVLDGLAEKVKELTTGVQGIVDPDATVRVGKSEIRIRPKRAVLADLSMSAVDLGRALRANLEGLEASTFKRGDRTYDIRVKFEEEEGKNQIEGFLFPGGPGRPLLLANLASLEESLAPIQITRVDKRRVAKLYANLANNKPLGTAVAELSGLIDRQVNMPAGYRYRFMGQYEALSESTAEFAEVMLIAMLLTYLMLAAILESFSQPILILVTVPLALIGMLWALYLSGESISIFVLLGLVMLMGIVVNNAILIMEGLNQHRAAGLEPGEAMVRAATDQFRPIVMITLAAVLGMLPMALGGGLGSETRTGIGLASAGGIAVSGLLTFLVLPVLYQFISRRKPAQPPARER